MFQGYLFFEFLTIANWIGNPLLTWSFHVACVQGNFIVRNFSVCKCVNVTLCVRVTTADHVTSSNAHVTQWPWSLVLLERAFRFHSTLACNCVFQFGSSIVSVCCGLWAVKSRSRKDKFHLRLLCRVCSVTSSYTDIRSSSGNPRGDRPGLSCAILPEAQKSLYIPNLDSRQATSSFDFRVDFISLFKHTSSCNLHWSLQSPFYLDFFTL